MAARNEKHHERKGWTVNARLNTNTSVCNAIDKKSFHSYMRQTGYKHMSLQR